MAENRPIPDIEYAVALMQYINARADVRSFLKASGNDMARLCKTVDQLIEQGRIKKDGKKLLLTDNGINHLAELNKQLGRKGLYSSFIPDYSERRVQMKQTDVYIPQYMYKRGGGHFSYSCVPGRSGESSGDKESTI